MKRSISVLACILCLFFAAASAQTAAEKAASPAPSSVTNHLRIEVVMDNGGIITGVARDGLMVEKAVKQGFEALGERDRDEFDAGIRVWFYDGLPGFMFLRYRHIEAVRVVRPVTASEIKKLDARKQSWQEREGVLLPIERAVEPNPDVFAPPSFSNKPQPGAENLDDEQRKLLDRFPPVAGWTPERYRDLQRDVVLAAREMTVSEDQWARVYPEWLGAYRVFTGTAAPKAAPKSPSAASMPAVGVLPPPPARSTAPRTAPRRAAPAPAETGTEVKGLDVKTLQGLGKEPDDKRGSGSRSGGGVGGIQRGGQR